MKRFSRIMLGIILTSLLAGSIQYVAADDSQNKKSYEDFQMYRKTGKRKFIVGASVFQNII